jgi:pyruvate dehydrogenase E2 component (dihydrolipoamide acetyltransferase)
VATGTVVALLLAEGEQSPRAPDSKPGAPVPHSVVESVAEGHRPDSIRDDVLPQLTPASPKARRLAVERGVEIATIQGTGPDGAVLASDVLRLVGGLAPAGSEESAEFSIVPITGMRKTIADRTQHSYQSAPHISLSLSIDMTETLHLYDRMKASVRVETGLDLTMTAVLARVISVALGQHPRLNAHLVGDEIREYRAVHLGIAVALDDGLIVPVIHHAEQKKLVQLQTELHDLVNRARAGSLKREDVSGGTFTVSNLGTFGIEHFTAIVNPPQVGIAGAGVIQDIPAGREGQVVLRPMMVLTVNVDHRAVDGAVAAAFLRQLKQNFENPYVVLA